MCVPHANWSEHGRAHPNLLNPHDLAQLLDNAACEVQSLITSKLLWSSKDRDVPLVQVLGNGLGGLIRGNIGHNMFHGVILGDKNVNNLW